MTLDGRVAIVTGSGRNIGRATALELARRGAAVVVNARANRLEAEGVVGEIEALGGKAVAAIADVGDQAQVNGMVDRALEAFGRVDILVNNAGMRAAQGIADMTVEQWRQALAVNLDAPFFCAQAVVPGMMERGWGRIINVSGLNAFSGRAGGAMPPAAARAAGIPLGRLGMPEEIATTCAFLASDDASFITGQTIHVNGGALAY